MLAAPAAAGTVPLAQGFEDGAPAWTGSGQWHVQQDPQAITVSPDINGRLVTLADDGRLPAPAEGTRAAWFGDAGNGTYCGADYATRRQTPSNGCTSVTPQSGSLTSPAFSLAGRTAARVAFSAWWEIEAVNADVADQMRVEYSADGGVTWSVAALLNPAAPAWGGVHQAYTDAGARASGQWATYVVDISPAAGSEQARIRFTFDTIDERRNGFRGWFVDGVAITDAAGAVIQDDAGNGFADPGPPEVSLGPSIADQQSDGSWNVSFTAELSHPSTEPVSVDYTITDSTGATVGSGVATVPAGETSVTVTVPVSGTPGFTVTLTNPAGGTLPAGGTSGTAATDSLPAMSLGAPTATPAGAGETLVEFTVALAPAGDLSASVDWTITGADGAALASGVVTIPAGATSGSAAATLPNASGPFTVTLSNPQNAVLAEGGQSGTIFPAAAGVGAGGSAAGDPASGDGGGAGAGNDLTVLGIRQAGQRPRLGQTFVLTRLAGIVRYRLPGRSRMTGLPTGSRALPLGTVVDARLGRVGVTVENHQDGTLHSGEFWAGMFGVFQRAEQVATAELRLAGGRFAACPRPASRPLARKSAKRTGKVLRRLWSKAKGRFRTKGRFAAATVRGTQWSVDDLCLATRVRVVEGVVDVYDFRRKTTTPVRAGETRVVSALQIARYQRRSGRNRPRLSSTG